MSTLQKLNPSAAIPTAPKDAVAFWNNLAAQFARGQVASQVMCGFALEELKKEMGFVQGGFRGQKPNESVFDSWEDFLVETYHMTGDTARKWMDMAKGVRADFKKLGLGERFRALLATPPSQWNAEETKLLSDSLQKVTDGLTQTDFLRQLGLAKKPSGNPNASGHGKRALSIAEQASAEKILVEDCMNRILQDFDTLAGRFTVAAAPDLEIFDGVLMKHHTAIKDWLAGRQTAAQIAKLFTR